MRAMILAAGLGQRLRPLTHKIPKPLLCVRGKPLLVRQLEKLKKSGIQEIVINVHYLRNQIMDFLGDGSRFGVKIFYSIEEELLDTGGGILKALPLLGDKPFVVVSGDLYTEFNYNKLPRSLISLAHIVLTKPVTYRPKGDFALDSGRVYNIGDKMFNFANIGVYGRNFFKNCCLGVLPLSTPLRQAVQAGQVTGEFFSGIWYNVGTTLELEVLNKSKCI